MGSPGGPLRPPHASRNPPNRQPDETALPSASPRTWPPPRCRAWWPRLSSLRDDVLREPLQVADLVVERLGVLPHDVGDSEADDDVGDALVLEALDAVEGEPVDRDDVDLELVGEADPLLFFPV